MRQNGAPPSSVKFYDHPAVCPYCRANVVFPSLMERIIAARRNCPACKREDAHRGWASCEGSGRRGEEITEAGARLESQRLNPCGVGLARAGWWIFVTCVGLALGGAISGLFNGANVRPKPCPNTCNLCHSYRWSSDLVVAAVSAAKSRVARPRLGQPEVVSMQLF